MRAEADGLLPLICVNPRCRKLFRITARGLAELKSGLCPKCTGYLRKKRGDLLDPKLYALCQKIAKQERKVMPTGGNVRKAQAKEWRRSQAVLAKLGEPRLTVLEAERALGGPSPSAASGKAGRRGDSAGRDEGNR